MTKPPFEVPRGVFRARVAGGGAEEAVRGGGGPERQPRGGTGRAAGQGRRRRATFSTSRNLRNIDFELANSQSRQQLSSKTVGQMLQSLRVHLFNESFLSPF